MMEIDLKRALREPDLTFRYMFEGALDYPDIRFLQPVRLMAEYGAVSGGVRVSGEFAAVLEEECARCLEPVPLELNVAFDELFEREGHDDNYVFSGDVLSLDKLVYDEILLNIPMRLLCGEECKGLCGVCGQNLNRANCDCENKMEIDPSNPFYELSKLKDF